MADLIVRKPFGCELPEQGGQKGGSEEESALTACLLAFAACVAAAWMICVVTPTRPIPQIFQHLRTGGVANRETLQ